jgi:hypothetical protein
MADKVMEFVVAREMREDEDLRAAVELALRVPAGESLPPTAAVLDAVVPYFAGRLDRGMKPAVELERQRWTDLVAELRRQVAAMHRWQDRAFDGTGLLLEAAALLVTRGCSVTSSLGDGACLEDGHRFAYSPYGATSWCEPCLMWAALEGVPFTRHPAGWCDQCGTTIAEVPDARPEFGIPTGSDSEPGPPRCVCGHIEADHNPWSPMACEVASCACPEYRAAVNDAACTVPCATDCLCNRPDGDDSDPDDWGDPSTWKPEVARAVDAMDYFDWTGFDPTNRGHRAMLAAVVLNESNESLTSDSDIPRY